MKYRRRKAGWGKPRKHYRRKYNRKVGVAKRLARGPGYLELVRKSPIFSLTASAAVGTPILNDPNGVGMFKLGTPTASVGLPGNYYDIPFGIEVNLSQLTNYSELLNVFDQYKIKGVTIKIQNQANTAVTNGLYLPYIEYDKDQDDSGPPTTAVFRERMNIKTRYFTASRNWITLRATPKPAMQVYQSAIATGYAIPAKSQWLNTANYVIPHFCLKGVIRNMFLPAGVGACGMIFDAAIHVALKDIQ